MLRSLGPALRRQRRVLVLFVTTVLIPAGILAFFGFRALETERLRWERLIFGEQQRALDDFQSRMEDRVESLRRRLASLLEQTAGEGPEAVSERLQSSASSIPGQFVFWRAGRGVFYPGLQYRTDSAPISEPADFRKATNLEFSARDLDRAEGLYKGLLESREDRIRWEAAAALGRVAFRREDLAQARERYRTVLDERPQILDSESAVVYLIAGLQLGELLSGSTVAQADMARILEAFSLLSCRPRIVSGELIRFYAPRFEVKLETLCASGTAGQDLCGEYSRCQIERARERRWVVALEAVGSRLPDETREDGAILESEEGFYQMTVSRNAETPGAKLALLLEEEELMALIAVPSDPPVKLQISGPKNTQVRDQRILPWESLVSRQPIRVLPSGWEVAAFHGPETLGGYSGSEKIYAAVLLTLIGILVFGGFLTLRGIHREMEFVRLKTEFVSVVSHEFRTPITSIQALVERLEGGLVGSEEKRHLYLGVIGSELQRLIRLVNNLLDFSRIDIGARKYQKRETDLAEAIDNIVRTFRLRAEQSGFRFDSFIASSLPLVEVDRDAVAQAVLNLLDNALKYSHEKRSIRLSVDVEEGEIVIRVTDRGCGIPEEHLDEVFAPSYRGEAGREMGIPGIGLGLSIVRHVAEGHGGRVAVESEMGQGSTFALILPIETSTPRVAERNPDFSSEVVP